jgi:glycosyltransferase involved in cell wall biosynthesis
MGRAASIVRRLPKPVRRALKRIPGSAAARDALSGKPALAGPGPGELRAVVYLPTWAHWDVMRQRPQFMLEAFAKAGHAVYFVDPSAAEPRNAGSVHIVQTLAETPSRGVILYTHFAPVRSMFDGFDDPVIVYDILDDLSIFDEDERGMPESRRVRSHHPTVMADADVVLASAPALIERHSTERSDIIYVENGVDPERFGSPVEVQSDAMSLMRPIVGYHGMVSRWFDFDLVRTVAELHPDWSIVLVGPTDPSVKFRVEQLGEMDNVHFLGPKDSDEIAGYVQRFDVGLVPFVVDDMTIAVSPLKMYEYLAAGVPVVATPLPVCISHPLVATAPDAEGFSALVEEALAIAGDEGERTARIAAAESASWDSRLQPVLTRLDALGKRRVPQ